MIIEFQMGIILGMAGAGLTIASFLMKDMLKLRSIALIGNIAFLMYGIIEAQLPSIILNCVLIPVNAKRVFDIKKLLRHMKQARPDSPVAEWLLPNMTPQEYKAGHILFKKDESADQMLYIKKGKIRFIEIDKIIGPGELIGEMALFLPDSKRTLSIECVTDCELYSLEYDEVHKLAYNHPELSYYLAQLMIGRILESRVLPNAIQTKQISMGAT
jgi:hypothetical protein